MGRKIYENRVFYVNRRWNKYTHIVIVIYIYVQHEKGRTLLKRVRKKKKTRIRRATTAYTADRADFPPTETVVFV